MGAYKSINANCIVHNVQLLDCETFLMVVADFNDGIKT